MADNVFQPFQRLDDASGTRPNGLGLALALALALAKGSPRRWAASSAWKVRRAAGPPLFSV